MKFWTIYARIARRSGLRTLDALHLATALVLREVVTEFLSFDAELNGAATAHGIALVDLSRP